MSQERKHSQEIVSSVLLKLSRGGDVSKEEADTARNNYNAMILELDSYNFIRDMDMKTGQKQNLYEKNMADFDTLRRQYEGLTNDHERLIKDLDRQKENYQVLRKNHEGLKTENQKLENDLDNYKTNGKLVANNTAETKEKNEKDYAMKYQHEIEKLETDNKRLSQELKEQQDQKCGAKYTEKACNTDMNGIALDSAHRQELENLRKANERMNEKLQYNMNKDKQDGKSPKEYRSKSTYTDQEPEVSKAMDKLRQQNKNLSEEKNNLTYQIDELRTRLSMMASHKLTAGNPDIADLSDAYRPTKIAELFRELYDNEWTSAFEELEQKVTDNDVEVIDILADIIKNVDNFCSRAQLQQFVRLKDHAMREIREPQYQVDESDQNMLKGESTDNISRTQEELADKLLKDFRKSLGTLPKTPLRMIFYKAHMSPFKWGRKMIFSLEDAKAFAEKTLDLVWMMKIQDPPMELTWCERGDRFNKDMYSYYTKRGDSVTQCIWPAVVLHKGGPLMSKGVVQGD